MPRLQPLVWVTKAACEAEAHDCCGGAVRNVSIVLTAVALTVAVQEFSWPRKPWRRVLISDGACATAAISLVLTMP